ncbi:Alpha/Beta hydrolase protein [Xylariomycetidae sp. FL2044]|nr:Alpha/Beta hydrolase protein [Xylariomycetidae sp. FL2044]
MALPEPSPTSIPSPRTTLLPFLSPEDAGRLAYPPNALRGARDVETFYGVMRVYEWGPEDGEKVLFVHGDATPCLIFANIAQGLVDAGYRVLLFDSWGRGYSDTPLGVRHDERLFASQILLALTSSPLSWIGGGSTFSIVGFSLGGPISLTFAAAFPLSVQSLVLLGPAGLLRAMPSGYKDKLMHQPELAPSPDAIREKVREILGTAPTSLSQGIEQEKKRVELIPAEKGPSRVGKAFDMDAILQWQFDHHEGHIHSFQDTIRYFRVQNRVDLWGKVADVIKTRAESPLYNSRLLLLFGKDDNIVVGKETLEDILRVLPESHIQVEYLPGGHGFPYPNSGKIVQTIQSFWETKSHQP